MKNFLLIISFFTCVNSSAQKNELIPELRNRKWGYVNNNGEVVVDFLYEGVSDFSEGLAAVKKNGKYGYINQKGEIIIDFQFDFADDFKNSFGRVAKKIKEKQKWGYVNKAGKLVHECQYDYAENFDGFYAKVTKNRQCALLGTNNKLFLNKWFIFISSSPGGFIRVVDKNENIETDLTDKYIISYYDKKGKMLANRWFSGGGGFYDGKAFVSISGKCFILDKKGRLKERMCENYDIAKPIVGFSSDNKVDVQPQFPGGDLALKKFIARNIKYPGIAREQGIQGTVFVRFEIAPNGKVVNPSIIQSLGRVIDDEVIRVIESLPKWEPGIKNGIPVIVSYVVPVNFFLQ